VSLQKHCRISSA